ncbi:hypothetical protein Sme01_03040 [Sphaerisporangium melleum]|uniref:Uncharacterized protein n=1 Tax=Sphaerisporangium melleum TaxID=321316 RepID=A0A917QP31_9ACTN|nr:hypothetical protein [Sphaerisporangium melleum]GGK61343.1 hypothetical protein GCM10007964_00580 [Sphaerisporangium melleum]GII67828.1 hypothetical protein Sme01_03040 [Sphaerisporangium melleum]
MSEPFNPDDVAHKLAQAVAQMREMLAPLDEATLGYRRQLEETGWSPEAAEEMALSFHRMAIGQMASSAG